MNKIAVLFARADSVYKTFPQCDVYDAARDALTYPGGLPIVAHPPCRGWGGLSHMAKHTEAEKQLAVWSVEQIRRDGGVLEHPKRSSLWQHMNLPAPGKGTDEFGGFSVGIAQSCFGHRAEKLTLLYIVGCTFKDLPPIPYRMGESEFVVGTSGRRRNGTRYKHKKEISKAEREHTPVDLAKWLCETAAIIGKKRGNYVG